jgi:peptide/nickel transport system permease protein
VTIALLGGVVMGGVSGYYGGWVDTIIQRIIEVKSAIPTLPLWMGLSAAVPQDWSVLQVYLGITVVLSIFAWTGMARTVRGKFLALREEDYVMAARLSGASESRIMFRHMLPGFYSHLIATISLSIPGMIVGETSLSFLGLGLRPPAVSYGIMLIQAQNPVTVALYPWLMFVALPVIVVILAFNFLGDGLRDAADPYGK